MWQRLDVFFIAYILNVGERKRNVIVKISLNDKIIGDFVGEKLS